MGSGVGSLGDEDVGFRLRLLRSGLRLLKILSLRGMAVKPHGKNLLSHSID